MVLRMNNVDPIPDAPVGAPPLEITENTLVSDILDRYGDIADVMEAFGISRVGRYSIRRLLTKVLTVRRAAVVHGVPLDEFLTILRTAVSKKAAPTVAVDNR